MHHTTYKLGRVQVPYIELFLDVRRNVRLVLYVSM